MDYPNLRNLQQLLTKGAPPPVGARFEMPPAIARTLGIELTAIDAGTCTMELTTDPKIHGNPMGTVHGGVLADLADAAIGTAHSTLLQEGESFTSVDLMVKFFRPVWKTRLKASAKAHQSGRTLSYYICEVVDAEGKLVATVNSTVMTLRGDKAQGR